jgi:PST family polysaccharide transporter
MSLARKAARGAAWTIVFGLGARAIGVTGTLVMTHLLHPEVIGEVGAATIVCMIFNWVTSPGLLQYLVVKGRGDAETEVTWHVTVAMLALGSTAILAVILIGPLILPWFSAADGARYVPGMALALGIKRLAQLPEKILTKQMRFRATGISMAVGETAYAATSVLLAWRGWGGFAIVVGNIVQSSAVLAIMVSAAGVRSWWTRTALRRERFRDMWRFGAPLGVEGVAHYASRYVDNLLMARYFGTGPMALYNMGYNLADIPAIYVGEQIGGVLLPGLAELPPERRPAALERSSGLLALIIFPMAIGLAAVSQTLVAVALSAEWQGVAPLLTILSVVSLFRPISWVLSSYLQVQERTRLFMWLDVAKLALLLGGIAILQRWGIEVAATSVGVAFGASAIAGVWAVTHGPPPVPSAMRMFSGFARPAAACAVMAAAVLGARYGLRSLGVTHPGALLPVEIIVGAAVYIPAALILARPIAKDFLKLLREMRSR